jgi:succinoglycan biosynthesis protein ExoL
LNIAYFVHDLNDPAVHRRIRMLRAGGADVSILGFSRGKPRTTAIEGIAPLSLGSTANAQFGQRLVAIARAILRSNQCRPAMAGADLILARQLEMLGLAAVVRTRFASKTPIVYEILDIHTLMLSPRQSGRVLRAVEGYLLRRCQALMVSAPAFVREYFRKTHAALPPVILSENKVLASEAHPAATGRPQGPPWRIGWFGVLRCRRSLAALAALARQFPTTVQIILRGRPALDALPDFHAVVNATPGMQFLGPYSRHTDLPTIYGDVHFTWAIDFYEAGANSAWLLPNRLYEGTLYGAVPLALASVETGRWLRAYNAGILLDDDIEAALPLLFAHFDGQSYETAKAAIAGIPRDALVDDDSACRRLVQALSGSKHPGPA